MMNKLIKELVEVTKQIEELKLKEIDLWNRYNIILVKLNKKWKDEKRNK